MESRANVNDLLNHRIRRAPPQTQQECCQLAARQSIATLGPVHDEEGIRGTAIGLAAGLFGDAFDNADAKQQAAWIDMCEQAYRAAIVSSLARRAEDSGRTP
jgi:hypothetical protein